MEVSWKATTNSIKMIFLDALVLHIIFPTLLETKEFLIKVDVSLLFQMWVLSTVAFFLFLFLTMQLASLTQIQNPWGYLS